VDFLSLLGNQQQAWALSGSPMEREYLMVSTISPANTLMVRTLLGFVLETSICIIYFQCIKLIFGQFNFIIRKKKQKKQQQQQHRQIKASEQHK
jgi:hypothetical protein